jgi:hypothetical protein
MTRRFPAAKGTQRGRLSPGATVGLLVLLGAYLVVAPWLNARWGWNLPGWREFLEPSAPIEQPTAPLPSANDAGDVAQAPRTERVANDPPAPPSAPSGAEARNRAETTTRPKQGDARLTAIASGASLESYESPAGLVYGRGSQHRHRLRHLLAHAVDEPDRPGSHGVFSTQDPDELVAWIDEAFVQARAGRSTRTQREGDRTVHTVDMGRVVGFVGGETGAREGRPPARKIRIVLEDRRVITAFPVR